jgi:hypothetical protein
MGERVYGRLSFVATWPVVALLVVACVICVQGFLLRMKVLGPENEIPDAQVWYTPAKLRDMMDRLGERGRTVYAVTTMTLDVIFPLVYGGLFAALIAHVYRPPAARVFAAVPALAVAADLAENTLASYYAWNFDGAAWPLLARVATTATALKYVLFILSLVVITAGGLKCLASRPADGLPGPD